jgi:hypothetical protein
MLEFLDEQSIKLYWIICIYIIPVRNQNHVSQDLIPIIYATANENTYDSTTVATNSTIGYDRNELGL